MMTDVQPLRPLTLEEPSGAKWAFSPQSDVTPLESVLLAQLFVRMVMTVWHGPVDWLAYVQLHKLDRHFRLVKGAPMLAGNKNEIVPLPVVRMTRYIFTRMDRSSIWSQGQMIDLLEGMPVPDGFVEATPENVRMITGVADGRTQAQG